MITTLQTTAVLVANSFNVPIFTQLWLVENGILEREDFGVENHFSPVAVNVSREGFNFLVVPERVQVRLHSDIEKAHDAYSRIIGGIAKVLPHTPFSGFGLNIDMVIHLENQEQFVNKLRDLFAPTFGRLGDVLSNGDERFGSYLSQNVHGSRMKLDMKPVIQSGSEGLLLSFNFHREASDSSDILDHLSNYTKFYGYANEIAGIVNEAMEN